MNLAPFFSTQFVDADGLPLVGGFLYTYASGTTTPQTTYEDQAGSAENENPIELDAAGRCDLWLDPTLEYDFLLKRADLTTVRSFENVAASAVATDVVTSVNTLTGDVVLTAEDIDFDTGTSTDWFVATDIAAAIDALITRADTGTTAASVTIADAGSYFTGGSVEAALQQLGAAGLPSQTGNSGKFLTTNGSSTSWAVAGAGTSTQAATGTITLPGGLIMKWGTTATLAVDSSNTITFATAFPHACFIVTGTPSTDNGINESSSQNYSIGIHTWTTAQFEIEQDGLATTVTWFAIGN